MLLRELLELLQIFPIVLDNQVCHLTLEKFDLVRIAVDNLAIVGRLSQELVDGDFVDFVRFDLDVDF